MQAAQASDSFRVLRDSAVMSANVYGKAHLADLIGWTIPEGGIYENADNGLKIVCYLHEDYRDGSKRAVIVFRGTDNFSNLKTDLEILLGKIPSNFCTASSVVNRMIKDSIPAGYRLFFSGHSLGGIYATLFAHLKRTSAITFDSPGVKPLIESEASLKAAISDPKVKILNYVSAPHVVNTLYPQCGQTFRVFIGFRSFEVSINHIVRSAVGSAKHMSTLAAVALVPLGEAVIAARGVAEGASVIPKIVRGVTAAVNTAKALHSASPLASRVVSHTVDAADYLTWLLGQHKITNIVAELAGSTERLRLARVDAWPKLTLAFPGVLSGGPIKSEVPFHPDSEGIHTLFDEQRFLEERLVRYYGNDYKVTPFEGKEAVEMQGPFFVDFGRVLTHVEADLPVLELLDPDNLVMQALSRYVIDSKARIATALGSPSTALTMYPSGHLESTIVPVSPEAVRESTAQTQTHLAVSFAGAIIVSSSNHALQVNGGAGYHSAP